MNDHEIHKTIDDKNKQLLCDVKESIGEFSKTITLLITTENQNIKKSIDQLRETVIVQNHRIGKSEDRIGEVEKWQEGHKGEEKGEDRGLQKIAAKQSITWQRVLGVVGAAIALSAVLFTAWNSNRNYKLNLSTEGKVENKEMPFVMNNRGEFVALPDSTVIKWFSNDSVSYMITRNKK